MGIRRLAARLEPYFHEAVVGCKHSAGCRNKPLETPPRLTIDGPGLAYHVYYKLLSLSGAASAFDALPSYESIGQIVISFLDELRSGGVEILAIYFDGGLPKTKRPERVKRLESCLKLLKTYKANHPHGAVVKIAVAGYPYSPPDIGSISHAPLHPPTNRKLPALPFLVPAVIEFLRLSKYSSLVKLVPAEADMFCAFDARMKGSTVLTADSDLLVHDLGLGSVTFFDQLFSRTCDECRGLSTLSRIFTPKTVHSRINIDSLTGLAYELQQDPTITIAEAIYRAKKASKSFHQEDYVLFAKDYDANAQLTDEYQLYDLSCRNWDSNLVLDPRVSEFIVQVNTTLLDCEPEIYLPFLIEDPSRASSWDVSAGVRSLAYSIAILERGFYCPSGVIEHYRKGDIRPNRVTTTSSEVLGLDVNRLLQAIDEVKTNVPSAGGVMFWRVLGMHFVLSWYRQTNRNLPSDELISDVLRHLTRLEWKQWSEVHLTAQLEAALYSLRMLKQIIDHYKPQSQCLLTLSKSLAEFPSLFSMLPGRSRSSYEELDTGELKSLVLLHQVGSAIDKAEITVEFQSWHGAAAQPPSSKRWTEKIESDLNRKYRASNNLYDLLPIH